MVRDHKLLAFMQKPLVTIRPVAPGKDREYTRDLPGSWFSVHQNDGIAHVSIFDEIGACSSSAQDLIDQVSSAEVRLTINSNGGCSRTAFEVYDAIRGRCAEATVTGRCFSAATILLMAAKRVRIVSDAHAMVHSVRQFVFGTPGDLRKAASDLDRLNRRLTTILHERTGQPSRTVRSWLERDTYFDAVEAVRLGLADEIITLPSPPVGVSGAGFDQRAGDGPTEDERMVLDLLRAAGPIQVRDPARFAHEVAVFLLHHSTEAQSCS